MDDVAKEDLGGTDGDVDMDDTEEAVESLIAASSWARMPPRKS
jgi:hypothetical protein